MLQFNSIILHNFGSYSHAEIDLQSKGFCLVTGTNNFKKDNAKSNGSGKSFIWSGICFAITGETIQGLKSNLKNIYNDESDAYVTLDFIADGNHYVITRYIAPKTDLKIIKDGTDVSGKGIRESEQKLAELLPDLTSQLIASTIIIGQGMPSKFSSYKPSGRKDLLEKLTKSDFMITDIKNRIAARLSELTNSIRDIDDSLLINKTNLKTYSGSLESAEQKAATTVKPDFDKEIKDLEAHIKSIEEDIVATTKVIAEKEAAVETANKDLVNKTNEKAYKTQQLLESYTNATSSKKATKASLETQLRAAENKLRAFRTNPDVCPTCGQKLPNAEHIIKEKEAAETEVKNLTAQINSIKEDLAKAEAKNADYKKQINDNFDNDISKLNTALAVAKNELSRARNDLNDFNHYKDIDRGNLIKAESKKATWDRDQQALETTIKDLTKAVEDLNKTISDLEKARLELDEHLQRVKWLDTLTKRDFRGYILTDIIKYLDSKSKAYAELVFGHKDLNIYLDGNDLDISYAGKMFDNLSGGEKTRVDLIIQFAIRDLLTTYMNAGSNILVLDEVTDFLDATSCEAVMKMIEKELKSVESVFIISHHAEELNLPIDSRLNVDKGEDGISTVSQG